VWRLFTCSGNSAYFWSYIFNTIFSTLAQNYNLSFGNWIQFTKACSISTTTVSLNFVRHVMLNIIHFTHTHIYIYIYIYIYISENNVRIYIYISLFIHNFLKVWKTFSKNQFYISPLCTSGSPQRNSGLDPGPVNVKFMLDKMAVETSFSRSSSVFFPVIHHSADINILRRLVLTLSLRMSGYRCQAYPLRIHDEHSVTGTEFSRNIYTSHVIINLRFSAFIHLSAT
jgi:hypothetical protein